MATEKAIEQVKKRIYKKLGIKYLKKIKSKKYFIGMDSPNINDKNTKEE